MSDNPISYRSGYNYQLAEDYPIQIPIKPDEAIDTQFITLDALGNQTVKSGYAWDSNSGPESKHFNTGAFL